MQKIKNRLRSKTYLTALVGALLTALDASSGLVTGWLPQEVRQYAVLLWPVAMLTLREVTTGALDDDNA